MKTLLLAIIILFGALFWLWPLENSSVGILAFLSLVIARVAVSFLSKDSKVI